MSQEKLSTVAVPVIEEYTFRGATIEDAQQAADLVYVQLYEETGETPGIDVNHILNEWNAPNFIPETATLIALSDDDQLVALYEVWDNTETAVMPFIWGYIHPDHRNRGLGTAMLQWAEERVLAGAQGKFDDDVMLSMRVYTKREGKKGEESAALFKANGFEYHRSNYSMRIILDKAPPAPVFPEGIQVFTYTEKPDIRAFAFGHQDSFRDHYGFVDRPLEKFTEHWQRYMEGSQFDPNFWFIAMDGDEVAGVVIASPHDDEVAGGGIIPVVGVRRPYRKQGLALALLHHAFGKFHEHGIKNVELGVDASSLTGATRLYERAGMHIKNIYDNYRKILREGREIIRK